MSGIIVGLGEILWDMLPGGKVLGGAPANFAYYASRLGCEACVVSAVGHDELGEEILSRLQAKGLKQVIERVDYPTGRVSVDIDIKGIPNYTIEENVAWDYIPFSLEMENLAAKTSAVAFGSLAQRSSLSRGSIWSFLNQLPRNAWRIFDANLRGHYYSKEIIEESLFVANILKVNDDELDVMTELLNLDSRYPNLKLACEELIKKYDLEIVILTEGEIGSYVITENDVSFVHTPRVKVVDTVGAGDAFTAGFISSYIQNHDIYKSHQVAVKLAAMVCTEAGAMSDISVENISFKE